MKYIIAIIVNLSLTSIALAGEFATTPNGQLLFTPQSEGVRFYQSTEGGPPRGYAIELGEGNLQLYHPFDGSSSYVIVGEGQPE